MTEKIAAADVNETEIEVTATALREQMVQGLIDRGTAHSPAVIAALQSVPRHLVDGVDVTLAYSKSVFARKTGEDGVTLSTISAVGVQALQLEQADLRPGHRVLEIGSGGVNAAYLAELVGSEGLVVTMDIDPEITDRAERFLAAAGYDDVVVRTGDATFGAEQYAPFDRIIVTVETTDIPPAWWDQLAPDGRIVAPLRWRGLSRSVALDWEDDRLVGDDILQCGFVPMQGAGEDRQGLVLLHDEPGQRVALRVEGRTELDGVALAAALHSEPSHRWTGVTLRRGSSYEWLNLWLGAVLEPVAILTGDAGARDAGLVAAVSPVGVPTLVEESSFGYHTIRPTDDPEQFELGVIAHGPEAAGVADRYAEAVQAWDQDLTPHLVVARTVAPASTAAVARTVERRHARFTISWQ